MPGLRILRSRFFWNLSASYAAVLLVTALVNGFLADYGVSPLVGTSVGFLLALAIGLYFASRIAVPITQMTQVAQALRDGRYESRVRLRTRDEIGLLADTLNQLGALITTRIARISQEDAQLRAMLAGMIEGVVAVDENDRITFCNSAAHTFLEIPRVGVEGRSLWEVAPIAELETLLESSRRSGRHQSVEIELFRSVDRTFAVHVSPFQGGGRSGIMIVLHDMTELRRLERVRRDFVANVSHELKTPLTSIKGYVETLLAGALHDEENNERFLTRIEVNVERLTHLVSDLLSLARVEAGENVVRTVPVDWRTVAEEVCRRYEGRLKKKKLDLELVGSTPPVLADREALVQVIDNLVDNAIKYTPSPGHITLRFEQVEGGSTLAVEDSGLGIPADDLDRVFERFYRVDKARSRAMGSTGLGLSIVKNLVVQMDGDVRVDSQEGAGTTFTVKLKEAPGGLSRIEPGDPGKSG